MARYTGPMTKKSRRLGVHLVGGDKAFERRPYPPGVHGKGRTKESEYSLQLREKLQELVEDRLSGDLVEHLFGGGRRAVRPVCPSRLSCAR